MKEFLMEERNVGHINYDVSICVHKYEQAKKSGKLDDKIKEYLDRWEKLGFSQGFPEDRKEELAFAFEQLAVFLIFCEDDQTDRLFDKDEYGNRPFETIGFPMTRRVIGNLEPNVFDFQKFLKYCKIFNVNDMINLANEMNPLTNDDPNYPLRRRYNIDTEAEAVALACEMIEEKFKNPERDNEEIKQEIVNKLKKIIEDKIAKENEGTSSDNTNA